MRFSVNNRSLSEVLCEKKEQLISKINHLEDEIFFANSDEEIVENIINNFWYEPISMVEDIDNPKNIMETDIRNPYPHFGLGPELEYIKGYHFTFNHILNGSYDLLNYHASYSLFWAPENIEMSSGYLKFNYEQPANKNVEDIYNIIEDNYKRDLKQIKNLIDYANNDLIKYNEVLKKTLLKAVSEKKNRLEKLNELNLKMAIPIKKKVGTPNFSPIKLEKKVTKLSTKVKNDIEYYLPEEDYKEILRIIRHCGSSQERIPKTYNSMSEESLRDIFVSHLNVVYEGQVQGECFRNKGKTDICIEKDNRAAFVAECKVWSGSKKVKDTIEQLLGYITWKDLKLAIIFFNKKNKDFFSSLENLEATLKELDDFKELIPIQKNEFDLKLLSSNKDQILNIRIFMFNLYVDK